MTVTGSASPPPGIVLGGPRRAFDVTAYLTVWVVLLFGISAFQVVPGFGAIGSPALLYTLPAVLWWLAARAVPALGLDRSPSAMRVTLLLYGWYLLVSYVVAISRPLTELEHNGAHRGLITTISYIGMALLVLDGIDRLDRLTTLLRRVVWGGAFMSIVAVLQFATGDMFQIPVPGLVWNHELEVETRSVFTRPNGTAMHPIELSVVASALLPLAVHFALHARRGAPRQAAVVAAALIALTIPISLSRSGVLSAITALTIMFFGWGWRRRANAGLLIIGSVPLLWLLIPGLVGSIYALFAWFEQDTSITARIDRVPAVLALVRERPWLGLGNGTWSVEDYFLLDNEVYATLLAQGYLGLLGVVALFVVGILTALWVEHARFATDETAHLGRSLAAGLAAIGVSFFTFDSFAFRILTSLLFLFLVSGAALLRLTNGQPADR